MNVVFHINTCIAGIFSVAAMSFGAISVANAVEPTDIPSWLPPIDDPEATDAAQSTSLIDVGKHKPIGLKIQMYGQYFSYELPHGSTGKSGNSALFRTVFDYRKSYHVSHDLEFTLSDRLDVLVPIKTFSPIGKPQKVTNTLREAYVSFSTKTSSDSSYYFDVGRVNIRNGVGYGYNPTDFFKDAAVITSTSRDPGALRFNRLGVFMARMQRVGKWGSITIAAIPKLENRIQILDLRDTGSSFSLGLNRTNANNALYVKLAPKISEKVSVDLTHPTSSIFLIQKVS